MTDSPHLGLSTSRATGAGARTQTTHRPNTRSPTDAFLSPLNSLRRPASASRTYGRYAVDPPGRSLTPGASPRRAREQAENSQEKIERPKAPAWQG